MRQLPVFAAFGHAIKSTRDNLGFAFHVSWPWMLALVPLNVVEGLYFVPLGTGDGVHLAGDAPGTFLLAIFLIAAVNIVGFASIAVSWHRYILLDEVAHGWQRLRLDAVVWRYVGNMILIAAILTLASIPPVLVLVLIAAVTSPYLMMLGIYVLIVPMVAMFYRLGVKLPGIALDRHDYGIGQAWADTRDNFRQLVGLALLYLAVGLAVGFAFWILQGILGRLAGSLGTAVSVVLQVGVNWVMTILGVTMLTSLYGFFVEKREF
ncbi:MAG: hypothetical protein HYX36_11820 [Rhizobiales bacterium]|nr:hypothetical protein [Hyphomicrobiales bacterium]